MTILFFGVKITFIIY